MFAQVHRIYRRIIPVCMRSTNCVQSAVAMDIMRRGDTCMSSIFTRMYTQLICMCASTCVHHSRIHIVYGLVILIGIHIYTYLYVEQVYTAVYPCSPSNCHTYMCPRAARLSPRTRFAHTHTHIALLSISVAISLHLNLHIYVHHVCRNSIL